MVLTAKLKRMHTIKSLFIVLVTVLVRSEPLSEICYQLGRYDPNVRHLQCFTDSTFKACTLHQEMGRP